MTLYQQRWMQITWFRLGLFFRLIVQTMRRSLTPRSRLRRRRIAEFESRRVQKYKRGAKPLMVALSMIMIDELGDGPARRS